MKNELKSKNGLKPKISKQQQLENEKKEDSSTILIVEDSRPERARLVAMLSKLGYQIVKANNGCKALEILKSQPVRLVLSDWKMPVMSGFELCVTCKNLPGISPYFVLLTGRDAPCDLVAAMDAGADDYLTKPFNSEELRVRLKAVFRVTKKKANRSIEHP